MQQRNSIFVCAILGAGLCLTPLLAQDATQAQPPEQKQAQPQEKMQPQTWAGDLVDASCKSSAPQDPCAVTETTKLFGLTTADGKYYRLDGDSNSKVMTALQSSGKKAGAIKVSINGTMSGSTLKVESIDIK